MQSVETLPPRALRQPGRAEPDRIQSAEGALIAVERELEPQLVLAEAIERAIEGTGIRSGAVRFQSLNLEPMRYVRPTFSSTPEHVAYYSDVHAPDGAHRMDVATATLGLREGRVFIHCHALWKNAQGDTIGGHILPLDAVVAPGSRVEILGTAEVDMLVEPDTETNFSLFNARPAAGGNDPAGPRRMIVAKIRPNEDLVTAIEAVARRHDVTRAVVRSGIGSTIGAVFEDGKVVREIPTEILVLDGTIAPGVDDVPALSMTLALIDSDGRVHRGTLARGQNPVLICFELILEVSA